MPIEFDFDGARKSGATDKDISEYFKTKYNIEFDIEGAKKSGAKDADILGYLNTKYSEPLKKKRTYYSRFTIWLQNRYGSYIKCWLTKARKAIPITFKDCGNYYSIRIYKTKMDSRTTKVAYRRNKNRKFSR